MLDQTNIITPAAQDFIAKKYSSDNISVHAVEGGYSRNRRAIVGVGDEFIFAKEVDIAVLPSDGDVELAWLKKDNQVVNQLAKHGVKIVPEWSELHLNGHLLLQTSYRQQDGWQWTIPDDEPTRAKYTQAVIDATKELETISLSDDLTDTLSLQPFLRDEIAEFDGIAPLFTDPKLRKRLIQLYSEPKNDKYLSQAYNQMVKTLNSDNDLQVLQEQTAQLTKLPNSYLNHCDVRSDNIAYNLKTGEVKFVDWNWTSYAPAKFGATEFIIDMARRGADISPWRNDISIELLAATVGFFMIRSLKPPLAPGSNLRTMQAESAAVANYLYRLMSQ